MSHQISASAADSSQAQYFRTLLVERRSELEVRLADDARMLRHRYRSGSLCGVKAIERRIRRMERQRRELDRLLDALDVSLGERVDQTGRPLSYR